MTYAFKDVSLDGLREKIFLDRYAAKITNPLDWTPGNKVVALLAEDPNQPLYRTTLVGELVQVLDNGFAEVKDPASGTIHTLRTGDIEYSNEQEPKVMWDRIARAMSGVEKPEKQQEVYEQFAYALDDFKLVGGGRVMAGAGTEELTLINCFVIPSPHDSRRGIMASIGDMIDIMARGGGVGVSLSSLRPKRALVAGVNGHSSGSVSWGGMYSFATGLVEQGGSRRGALMLMLNDWHPDVMHFIKAKSTMGAITNANMSVLVSNELMEAVKNDREWITYFPDTKHPAYDTEWDGDIKKWRANGCPVIKYDTYSAREIWNILIESAWKSAEPGVVFEDYIQYYSNSWYYNRLVSTNPCGEQPLPPFGVCNLSAINLSKFYDKNTHDVDWTELAKITRIGVRFCDNVTTFTMYPLDQIVQNQTIDERRSGLGTMGLAELMIKLEIRYGSEEGVAFLDKLFSFIAYQAYMASSELAAEKGSFGKFNAEYYLQSGFLKNMVERFPQVGESILKNGMRNVCVITQAPTGSSGTMAGTSTGIEPYFAFKFTRNGRLGSHVEYVPIAQDWLDDNPGKELPEWFVTSQDLAPEDHVRVQAAIQKWTDSAISKTANAPHDFTVEDTKQLYELAWELGCKGVTIYRDGSRDIQVLSVNKETEKEAPLGKEKAEVTGDSNDFQSSKMCEIRIENGQVISECGTE